MPGGKLINYLYFLIITSISIFTISRFFLPNQVINSDELRTQLTKEFFDAERYEDSDSTGIVVEYKITAEPASLTLFGNTPTDVYAYNRTVPGPIIRVRKGDTLKVDFTNNLSESTTIHWHGVRVPNSMDGVPGITQDSIAPGETFTYEFTLKDTGTYWFHPHQNTAEQVERGLYGVLIVEEPLEMTYDNDVVWVLDDWRLTQDNQIDDNFNTMHDLMHDGRWGQIITINSKEAEGISASPGSKVLLRLVNTANGRVFRLDFGSLETTLVGLDGQYTNTPTSAQGVELSPGSRAEVVITIPPLGKSQHTITDTFTNNTYVLGAINVSGEPAEGGSDHYYNNYKVPKWENAHTFPPDKVYNLNARRGGEYGIEWTINDMAYPNYDPLELKYGEFNKIAFVNESARLHPMHLHGQFFKVISRNGKKVDEPYFRDTVLLGPRETVEIGLVPLDKGKWMNHCHILEHAEAGMMTIIEVR